MAATITSLASGSSGSNPFSTGSTVTVQSGDWLVAVIALAVNRVATVTDTGGNTWIERAAINYDGAATGGYLRIVTSAITSGYTNGTVTVTLSSGSAQNCIQVYRVRPSSGTISFVAADTTGSGSTTTTHSAATVSVAAGNTIFGCAAVETNDSITGDSDTTNGSWSSVVTILRNDGSDDLSQSSVSQYKTVSLTGNQSWACATTSARESARSYLVIKAESAVFSLAAAQGQYTLSGTAMTPRLGNVPIVAGVGSYALTGTAATFINSGTTKTIAAVAGDYSLLGTDVTLATGHRLDATIAGSYALTGTDVTLTKTGTKSISADSGSYSLSGSDAIPFKTTATAKVIIAENGTYALTGTAVSVLHAWRIAAGDEALDVGDLLQETGDELLQETGDEVLLDGAANITGGTYALIGTDATLAYQPTVPPVVTTPSPLHIGEWPLDKRRRRAREDARAREQRARDRFRRAIARLLEGLPPEFDEPADLDEALDSAVQAANLLYAMSAPIREINAVNELIDHIRQLRIAQPIAQLAMAQAYNQAHRHLRAKAQEDTVMALLLGE